MRDITLGETVDFKFTTAAPDTGAPTTLSGTPAISAYVGNSTTQITAGITLTVDFDSVTGLNNVRVVATSGNGYTDNTDVALIITTGTVDGNSAVGYKVAEFTIGRSAAYTRLGAPAGASVSADIAAVPTAAEINAEVDTALSDIHLDHLLATDYDPSSKPGTATALLNELVENDSGVSRFTANALENASGSGATLSQIQAGLGIVETTIASLSSQTSFTLTAGSADDDAYNGYGIVIRDASTSTQTALGVISDYTGSSKTVTLEADPGIFTMATGDAVILLPATLTDSVWDELTANHTTADTFGKAVSDILTDTAEIGAAGAGLTEAGGTGDQLTALSTQASVDTIDSNVDAILVDTGTTLPASISGLNDLSQADVRTAVGLASANLDTQLGALPTAAENRAEMDSNSTQLAAIVADTNELQTDDVPGLIAALNDLSAADVNAEVVDALNTDTYAEPGQGSPASTASLATKIGYLYKAWRNRSTQTASEYALYADDGTTKDQEAAVSDNGTTLDRSEVTTGA